MRQQGDHNRRLNRETGWMAGRSPLCSSRLLCWNEEKMTTVKRAPSRVRGTCERGCSQPAVAARAMIFILGLSGECLLATLLIRLGQNWARASPRTADASCKGHNYAEEGAVEFPAIASPARECAMCATGSSLSVSLVRSPRIITFVVYNSEIAAPSLMLPPSTTIFL